MGSDEMQSLEDWELPGWPSLIQIHNWHSFLQPALLPQIPRPTSDGGVSKEIPIPVLGGLKAYPA